MSYGGMYQKERAREAIMGCYPKLGVCVCVGFCVNGDAQWGESTD